jgi:hypothetical protein
MWERSQMRPVARVATGEGAPLWRRAGSVGVVADEVGAVDAGEGGAFFDADEEVEADVVDGFADVLAGVEDFDAEEAAVGVEIEGDVVADADGLLDAWGLGGVAEAGSGGLCAGARVRNANPATSVSAPPRIRLAIAFGGLALLVENPVDGRSAGQGVTDVRTRLLEAVPVPRTNDPASTTPSKVGEVRTTS